MLQMNGFYFEDNRFSSHSITPSPVSGSSSFVLNGGKKWMLWESMVTLCSNISDHSRSLLSLRDNAIAMNSKFVLILFTCSTKLYYCIKWHKWSINPIATYRWLMPSEIDKTLYCFLSKTYRIEKTNESCSFWPFFRILH